MSRQLKLLVIAGARPNFMKVAPLMKAIRRRNSHAGNGEARLDARLVHTGQHYDEAMSEIFFRELGIRPPDINLAVGSGSHAVQTAKIMTGFEAICESEKPEWVVLAHGTQAIYKFGAVDERFQHLRLTNLVMWAAIKRCASLGFQTYHFGRTSLHDAALRRFKQGWGCRERLLEYFCIDLRTGGFVSKPDRANGWAAHQISRLPIPVVRQMGAVLYQQLI